MTLNTTAANPIAHDEEMAELPDGVPPLRTIYFYIAGSCNLACRHCWITPTFTPNGKNGKYLKFEHLESAVRQGKALGLREAKLTGGEPTLHPQFRDMVDLLHDHRVFLQLETNGTLVDRDLAQFLSQKSIYQISVSLDGSTPDIHDAMRLVEGSYDAAIRGIRHLVEASFRPQLICTLHHGNLSQLEEVIDLGDSLGCGSVKFNFVQQVGRGERFSGGLTIPEIVQVYNHAQETIIPHKNIRVVFDMPMAFRPIRDLTAGFGTCSVKTLLGVLSGGELSLCGIGVTIPDLIFGNIETDHLRDVWIGSSQLNQIREQIPYQMEGICSNCIHLSACLGHCVANNYHVTQQVSASFRFCAVADESGFFPAQRKINPSA